MNSITENRDDRSRHGILSLFFLLLFLSPVGAQSTSEQTTDQYRYKFSPSMAIIIVILIAALFFMVVFSVYIRQCSNSQSANSVLPVGNGAGIGRSRRTARGLDASVIETFPTMVYSVVKGLKIGKGALECAVCLNEFEDDETLRLIPKCDHVFHPDCIDAWLGSHTTCPVCRANLFPEPDETVTQLSELDAELDIEAQPDIEQVRDGSQRGIGEQQREAEVVDLTKTLNRNRTRGGSRSNRSSNLGWLFPRSHSTGHSLVQPGENTERYTLRLPVEVRKQIMNRELNRAMSMVVLPRESSSRRGYRVGGGGSSRGKHYKRIEESDRRVKSDRWAVSATSRFFTRMSSIKLPKVVNKDGEGTSSQEHPLNDKGLRSSDS